MPPKLPTILCLMGPTAAGKTELAIQWALESPCALISVDSAMVYREMDIGTAKPTAAELAAAPHALIDILDPTQPYSAGDFCNDAHKAITEALAAEKIPLLVGGTMLYFRALQRGLSPLPPANPEVRKNLADEANSVGWAELHKRLAQLDPTAGQRISPQDAQRIQRALEVHILTGLTLTEFTAQAQPIPPPYQFVSIGLIPDDRDKLNTQIGTRFSKMLNQGFLEEVEKLRQRGDLHIDLPSMRAVGYRQVWEYLDGKCSRTEMEERAVTATRQLAKRQLTWLRSWPELVCLSQLGNAFPLKHLLPRRGRIKERGH